MRSPTFLKIRLQSWVIFGSWVITALCAGTVPTRMAGGFCVVTIGRCYATPTHLTA